MKTKETTEWVSIKDELPIPNRLVWIKRKPNGYEENPVYLGTRNDKPLTENPDPSRDCHWNGTRFTDSHILTQAREMRFPHSFSDITVISWAYATKPD